MVPCKPCLHLHGLAQGDDRDLLSVVQPTESTGALCAATRSAGAAVAAPLLAAGSSGDGRQYAKSLLCGGTSCDPGEKASDVVLCQEGDAVDQLKEGPDVHHVAGAVLMRPGWLGHWIGVGDREMSDDPGVCQLAHHVLDLLRRAASWQWRSTVAMETNASRLSCVVLFPGYLQ